MKMREIIDIVTEAVVTPTVFYHGSKRRFMPGTILLPQSRGYVHGTGLDPIERKAHAICEAALERYRPRDAVPRAQAVFMCRDPSEIDRAGGYENNVYEVEPIGPVTACNLYWYSTLEGFCYGVEDQGDEQDLRQMARAYWTAAPNDLGEPQRDLLEYLAGSAKVMRRL